ncbi:MAG: hypothetical protein ACI86H_002492, partial [bacterium]
SEEHQFGEEYFDSSLYDEQNQLVDTFREFRMNIRKAQLNDVVVPIVAKSSLASKHWVTPLSMVFIDGGHSWEAAFADYRSWISHIKVDGILAIHDLFPDPNEGGQAPIDIYRLALSTKLFEELPTVKTLGILRRIS